MVGRINTSFSAGGAGTMSLNTNINVNTGGGNSKQGLVSTVGTSLSRVRRMKGGNNYFFKKIITTEMLVEMLKQSFYGNDTNAFIAAAMELLKKGKDINEISIMVDINNSNFPVFELTNSLQDSSTDDDATSNVPSIGAFTTLAKISDLKHEILTLPNTVFTDYTDDDKIISPLIVGLKELLVNPTFEPNESQLEKIHKLWSYWNTPVDTSDGVKRVQHHWYNSSTQDFNKDYWTSDSRKDDFPDWVNTNQANVNDNFFGFSSHGWHLNFPMTYINNAHLTIITDEITNEQIANPCIIEGKPVFYHIKLPTSTTYVNPIAAYFPVRKVGVTNRIEVYITTYNISNKLSYENDNYYGMGHALFEGFKWVGMYDYFTIYVNDQNWWYNTGYAKNFAMLFYNYNSKEHWTGKEGTERGRYRFEHTPRANRLYGLPAVRIENYNKKFSFWSRRQDVKEFVNMLHLMEKCNKQTYYGGVYQIKDSKSENAVKTTLYYPRKYIGIPTYILNLKNEYNIASWFNGRYIKFLKYVSALENWRNNGEAAQAGMKDAEAVQPFHTREWVYTNDETSAEDPNLLDSSVFQTGWITRDYPDPKVSELTRLIIGNNNAVIKRYPLDILDKFTSRRYDIGGTNIIIPNHASSNIHKLFPLIS